VCGRRTQEVLSRRLAVLMAAVGMVVLMGALASVAWAAPGAPTVVSTVPPTTTPPQTGVDPTANIKAKFSEAMKERSINTTTFYLLQGHFTALSQTKNPKRFCTTGTPPVTAACPAAIPATVSYDANTLTATLNPTSTLLPGTEYTAVVEGTGDGDMVAVKDTGGTPMLVTGTGDYIFYFTTAGSGGDHPTL
jgi:hypothetical protein